MKKHPAHRDLHEGIVTELILASGAALDAPFSAYNWSAEGIQRMQELALEMCGWIEYTVQYLGSEYNMHNPVNKLPPEVLCMIFGLAAERDFVEQLPFAGVCRRWRAVSLDNPTLWSKVYVTASFGDPTSRVALHEVAMRLEHTRPRPVDVTLHCENPAENTSFDPLENHMSHIRTLQLRLPREMFQHNFRTSLTMPTPSLMSLNLESLRQYLSDVDSFRFPHDLFSGTAPKLKKLSLKAITPPPPTWPPLQHLQHLTLGHSVLSIDDIAQALRACRALVSVSVIVQRCIVPDNWGDTATSPAALPHTPESANLDLPGISPSDLDRLLSVARYNEPRHFRVIWNAAPTALAWIAANAKSLQKTAALHVYQSYQDTVIAVRVVTQDSDNNTRTTNMRLQHSRNALFSAFRHFFLHIRRLTIGEQLWPTARLPVVPQLEELTVVLEWPQDQDDPLVPDPLVSVFFLPLTAGKEWVLPALRLLQFAYLKPGRNWSNQSEEEKGPLVISAHNIVVFLTWHLITTHMPVLGLRNVALFEPEDHEDTRHLLQRVQRLDQHSEYVSKGLAEEGR